MIIAKWKLNKTIVNKAVPWVTNSEQRISYSYRMTLKCTETNISKTYKDIRVPHFQPEDMNRLVDDFRQVLKPDLNHDTAVVLDSLAAMKD